MKFSKKFRRVFLSDYKTVKKFAVIAAIVSISALGVWVLVRSQAAETDPSATQWRGDYETCDLSQWESIQRSTENRVQIVNSPVRQGKCAAKFTVQQSDQDVAGSGDRQRSEVMQGELGIGEGAEQWYKQSVYIPADFSSGPTDQEWSIITQWHGAGGLSPNMALQIDGNRKFTLAVRGGAANQETSTKRYIPMGPLVKGKWYDFTYYVRWSSKSDGWVRVWMDGKEVITKTTTPTFYVGGHIKIKQGIYRSNHSATSYVVHDALRYGSLNGATPEPEPEPEPGSEGLITQTGNLATGKIVTASSQASVNYAAAKIIDGDETENTARWISAASDPEWVQVDLGSNKVVGKTSILWVGNTTKNYEVQTSTNGTTFTTVSVGLTDNQTSTLRHHDIANITARYIRIRGMSRWNANFGHSIREIGIYTGVATAKRGDINNDTVVNTTDLAILIAGYRMAGDASNGDLNGDGVVDIFDLSILLANWSR